MLCTIGKKTWEARRYTQKQSSSVLVEQETLGIYLRCSWQLMIISQTSQTFVIMLKSAFNKDNV